MTVTAIRRWFRKDPWAETQGGSLCLRRSCTPVEAYPDFRVAIRAGQLCARLTLFGPRPGGEKLVGNPNLDSYGASDGFFDTG